jgi:creatinine amidohydrolase/Fe(II)-dependent formamide hydrolase-like protein
MKPFRWKRFYEDRTYYMGELTWPDVKKTSSKSCLGFRTKQISETGVMGDRSKASREKGETAWKLAIERLADLLIELDELKF